LKKHKKISDKRVDKILLENGYLLKQCEIFYSPIQVGIFYFLILFITTIPYSLFFLNEYKYLPYSLIYGILWYLFYSYSNNSFVISGNQLLVINPNFPFKKLSIHDFEQVQNITIDNTNFGFIGILFLSFENNFVKISTKDYTKKYYCLGLELNSFDENVTEKDLDDFHNSLQKIPINLTFNLGQTKLLKQKSRPLLSDFFVYRF
jgi:hypothetical protein